MLPFLMTTCLTTKLYKEIEVVTQKSKQWREKVEWQCEYARESCHKSCQKIVVQISFLKLKRPHNINCFSPEIIPCL